MPIDTSRPGSKPRVCLWDHIGFGLIIEYPTGITYTNQTGGTCCNQPEAEGAFIPLRNSLYIEPPKLVSPENDLLEYFTGPKYEGTGAFGLDRKDADFIDSVLDKYGLSEALRVDRNELKESHEAWVYVTVLGQDSMVHPMFANFGPYPRGGVLTWCNSD